MINNMDRRTFLQNASIAAAAAIGNSTAIAGQFTDKIKKAVKYHMVRR